MREATGSFRQRTSGAVRASRAAGWLRRHARGLALATLGGVFLAFVGAFGTGEEALPRRLLYWVVVMLTGGLVGGAVRDLLGSTGWLEDRPWLQAGAVALMIAVILTGLVWAFTSAFFGEGAGFPDPASYFLPVLAVSAAMTAITTLADRTPPMTHQAPAGGSPPRLLERLPPRLRGADLYAVEAEDHYLRLHTSRGSDLILMRLSDALAELEGLEGAQTHRSWWVAREAVEDARRGDGRAVLRLKNGVEAPVSRTYARALRESGWF